MIRKIKLLIYLSIICISPLLLLSSQNHPAKDHSDFVSVDKRIKSMLTKMIYIEADTFVMGRMESFNFRASKSDSTLLAPNTPRRAMVDPFYISATEVTNIEWKAFYQDKVKELGQAVAKKRFYPDTSIWVTEFPYSYNASMEKYYFSKSKYNDYPVVGITWEQANAYCAWRTKKFNDLLAQKRINTSAKFRLPSEKEWERAAMYEEKGVKYAKQSFYAWSSKGWVSKINQLANIGQVHSINNVLIKAYADDGSMYTSKAGAYPPNVQGLYDVSGNVSEWTSEPGYTYGFSTKTRSPEKLTSASEIEKEIEYIKTKPEKPLGYENTVIGWLTHNQKVLKQKDTKICKGGNWEKGLIYTQIGSRQGIPKNTTSTKIGFRVVLSDLSPDALKYFPKKKWVPKK